MPGPAAAESRSGHCCELRSREHRRELPEGSAGLAGLAMAGRGITVGGATALMIKMIRITTRSSINVKPDFRQRKRR